LIRALAFTAAGKLVEAESAATAGVDAARAMGDRYRLGLALVLRAELRDQLGTVPASADRDEGRALLDALEVAVGS
jgi:hypothetical protein